MLLMLDNTKAFDRLQHSFMFDTLAAFNLPNELWTRAPIQRSRDMCQGQRC